MTFLRKPVIIFVALILCGCGSGTMEPIAIEQEELIRISGALNTSFVTDGTQYECQGKIKTWEIGNTLILSIKAKNNSVSNIEHISLTLYMPLDSEDFPIEGKYYTHELSDNFSGVSYKNQWNKNSFSKYRFETGLARIVIEESDKNHLTGKFSLSANQSYGQRTLNGQVENIKLTNQGKITVSGKIDVELKI